MFWKTFATIALASTVLCAPLRRQNPSACFLVGNVALPQETADFVTDFLSDVTCVGGSDVFSGVPDLVAGGISFSSIDFRDSSLSPVGFALQEFATPDDPAEADIGLLNNQLKTYLAVEAGLRSVAGTSRDVARLKGPKFFLQFQIARFNAATGVQVDAGGTVEHQLGKVLKNSVGASAAEKAEVERLSKLV